MSFQNGCGLPRPPVLGKAVNLTRRLLLILPPSPFQGKAVYFVSNNSSKSRAEYMQKFKKLDIEAYEVRCWSLIGHVIF